MNDNRYSYFCMRNPVSLKTAIICIVFLISCLVLSGCGRRVHYQEDAGIYAATVLTELEDEIVPLVEENDGKGINMTFEEACLQAAVSDTNILSILTEIQKSRIDVVEAATHKWPRLSAQAQAEIPFDGDQSGELDLTGGLYFKYDIWRAIAEPDEIALRNALVEKNLQKLRLHLNRLAGEIANKLTTLFLLDFRIDQKNRALSAAQQGLRLVEIYAGQNRSEGLDFFSWKKNVHTLKGEVKKLQQSKREQYDSLLTLLGIGSDTTLTISDADTILAGIMIVPSGQPSITSIWASHSEARLAEVEYVAAEVNIKLASMDRLPKLNASLGLGSIPLTGSDSQASTLFQLSMDLPLWDAGDHERKMARAQIEKGLVKERMRTKAVSLWNRSERARMFYEDSLEYAEYLQVFHRESENFQLGRKRLAEENRLSSLDIFRDRIELADVAIMEKEAALKIREAAANYRFAVGLDIVADMIPSLEHSLLLYVEGFQGDVRGLESASNAVN